MVGVPHYIQARGQAASAAGRARGMARSNWEQRPATDDSRQASLEQDASLLGYEGGVERIQDNDLGVSCSGSAEE